MKLNQFRDEMEQCVSNQDFGRAAELKQQIAELEEQKEILDSEENSFSQTVREEKVNCPNCCHSSITNMSRSSLLNRQPLFGSLRNVLY